MTTIKNEISVTFSLAEKNPNFVTFQHLFSTKHHG